MLVIDIKTFVVIDERDAGVGACRSDVTGIRYVTSHNGVNSLV